MEKEKIFTTTGMVFIALFTAVICILAPLSIPIGPVPISLTNLAIYFAVYVLGWKRGSISYLLYLLIGLAGVPVFSGFTGGAAKFAGPTGGYLLGFIFTAVISGWAVERFSGKYIPSMAGMIVGTMAAYFFGTAWFCISTGSAVTAALWICVIPFLPGDLVKMAAAAAVGPAVQRRLNF